MYRVTDACGNYVDVTYKQPVKDSIAPTFTVPANITICRVNGEIVAPTSETGDVTDEADNCTTTLDAVWEDLDTTPADNHGNRVIRRQWTLTDNCNNSTVKTQEITVRPSVRTAGNVTFTVRDTAVTLRYGVADTLLTLARAWSSSMPTTDMTVTLDSTGIPSSHRYSADNSPYTIWWILKDECGDTVMFKQTVTVSYPPCGGDFRTPEDGSGITYRTVQVGSNCWMAENMRATKYADTEHTPIPDVMTYPGADPNTYGYLYTYYAATKTTPPTRATRDVPAQQVQGICPEGWHIPDDADFEDLLSRYDGNVEDLMSTDNWLNPGTNASGYGLEPAGYYNAELGRYEYLYSQTYIWTYQPGFTVIYHACQFGSACGTIEIVPLTGASGLSVRCVHD